MLDHSKRPLNSRIALLCCTSSAVAFALAVSSTAYAQESDPQPAAAALDEKPAPDVGDILVTGTRVVRDGYKAPTPTSVIGAAEIAAKAPANIADFVNELPSLAASSTPRANVAFVSAGLVGINALNLRGLGESRTLVLLDGQRVGASTLTGLVDVNQFPQSLVKRVDVVTGGASAGWGSDAVAGIVNFVLDKDFTGLKGQVQGGVTTYGDDRSFNVFLTAGTKFADDRGHFMISGEIAHNDGITGIGKRDWYNGAKIIVNPAYVPGNGQPQLLSTPNVGFVSAPGGLITSGPLRGTYFGPSGTPGPFRFGSISSIYMQGGDWQLGDIGTSGDLDPEQSRQSIFARTSYAISDRVRIFAQGSYGRATANNGAIQFFNFGATIQPDNAFIPASIRPSVTGPFTMNTLATDIGLVTASTRRSSWRGVIGLEGDFDALGSNWTWDAYGQKSVNRSRIVTHIPINARFPLAIDAVRNANGVIVCRSTLTNPNNGCVPYNIFGTGVNGQAVADYINGDAMSFNKLTQEVAAATLRGDPFSTWAGEVSVAAGIEHRRESVSGSTDALAASSATPPYFAANYYPSFGSYNVTEAFLEAVVPLAKDVSFAKSLDLNAAVRATDYSISGFVTTWKVGLTYSPIEDITFRFTRSRDIRAPNLAELFQAGQTSTAVINDPANGNASVTIFQVARGNLGLKPEKADSLGLGAVFQPRFLPGFAASVDYYDIRINDAISSVGAQIEVNQCAAGNTVFCSQITRNAAGMITSVAVSPVNFAKQISRGLDFEASYRRPVLQGNLSLRVLATRYLKNYFDNGISAPTDTVGTNGYNVIAKNALPKWRYLASIGWDQDPFAVSLTARGFSAGVQNTSFVQCKSACPASTANNQTINDNQLPGAIYFDTNITVKLGGRIETFLAIDNILNKDPAEVAYGPGLAVAPLSVNPVLYDTLGRMFRFGVRFKM